MALSELVVRFKAPLRSGDAFRVETSVEQARRGCLGGFVATPWVGTSLPARRVALTVPAAAAPSTRALGTARRAPRNPQVTAARLVMRHAVVREAAGGSGGGNDLVCAEGTATVVFIDAGYRPMRLPAADREVFAALAARRQAAEAPGSGSGGGGGGGRA